MFKCFAFAALVASVAASPIEAAKKTPAPSPATLIDNIKKLDTFLGQFSPADIQMAIVHAGSQTPPDVLAASCWSTIRTIAPTHTPIDGKQAYAVTRLRLFEANQGQVNQNCAKVLPKFVTTFNVSLKAAKQAGP